MKRVNANNGRFNSPGREAARGGGARVSGVVAVALSGGSKGARRVPRAQALVVFHVCEVCWGERGPWMGRAGPLGVGDFLTGGQVRTTSTFGLLVL